MECILVRLPDHFIDSGLPCDPDQLFHQRIRNPGTVPVGIRQIQLAAQSLQCFLPGELLDTHCLFPGILHRILPPGHSILSQQKNLPEERRLFPIAILSAPGIFVPLFVNIDQFFQRLPAFQCHITTKLLLRVGRLRQHPHSSRMHPHCVIRQKSKLSLQQFHGHRRLPGPALPTE